MQGIIQSIGEMNYTWTNPIAWVVTLTPAVSLVIEKIQLGYLSDKINGGQFHGQDPAFHQVAQKVYTVGKWHALGSTLRMVTYIALAVLLNHWFAVLAIFELYQSSVSFFAGSYRWDRKTDAIVMLNPWTAPWRKFTELWNTQPVTHVKSSSKDWRQVLSSTSVPSPSAPAKS